MIRAFEREQVPPLGVQLFAFSLIIACVCVLNGGRAPPVTVAPSASSSRVIKSTQRMPSQLETVISSVRCSPAVQVKNERHTFSREPYVPLAHLHFRIFLFERAERERFRIAAEKQFENLLQCRASARTTKLIPRHSKVTEEMTGTCFVPLARNFQPPNGEGRKGEGRKNNIIINAIRW